MSPAALVARFRGGSLGARALRSSSLSTAGFATSQLVRLLSNLVLTRLLFPEAFGLMALVSVTLMGLAMFSDVGLSPAIQQSRRGDDRDFLDTAWTIQVVRGGLLCLAAAALGWPMAQVYGEPMLMQLLPVAGLTLLVAGFNPTRLETAGRHLVLGRATAVEITNQLIGAALAIVLAWLTGSVWALVASGVLAQAINLVLLDRFLPGARNRFRWEAPAARELVGFGKWIFLSTVCSFAFAQGDRILIGSYLPLDVLGVYNIGYFLAAVPMILGNTVGWKVLIPVYREKPPAESRANFLQLRRMRGAVTAALMAMLAVAALLGDWAVAVLYDPRYHAAGAVVVLLALAQIPQVVGLTYDQATVAQGNSRRFFVLSALRAVTMITCLVVGLETAGLLGAVVGQGVAYLALYPAVALVARRACAWDPLHDAMGLAAGAALAAAALWTNGTAIAALAAAGS